MSTGGSGRSVGSVGGACSAYTGGGSDCVSRDVVGQGCACMVVSVVAADNAGDHKSASMDAFGRGVLTAVDHRFALIGILKALVDGAQALSCVHTVKSAVDAEHVAGRPSVNMSGTKQPANDVVDLESAPITVFAMNVGSVEARRFARMVVVSAHVKSVGDRRSAYTVASAVAAKIVVVLLSVHTAAEKLLARTAVDLRFVLIIVCETNAKNVEALKYARTTAREKRVKTVGGRRSAFITASANCAKYVAVFVATDTT